MFRLSRNGHWQSDKNCWIDAPEKKRRGELRKNSSGTFLIRYASDKEMTPNNSLFPLGQSLYKRLFSYHSCKSQYKNILFNYFKKVHGTVF